MEMEKPVSTSGSGGSSFLNTVFIDTSLDTHLALMVSDSDTVSDLKKKILYEHPLCFPNIGEIKINALKVKRRGHLYHLSDSMFVKSAFDGMSKCWFLSVDASSTGEHRENLNSCKPDSGNVVECLGVAPNNSSADVVDLIPGGTSKGVSNINNASLPEDGNNCHAKQSSASQQFGFSNFTKENSEDLHMEGELTADSNSKVLLPAENKESRPKVQEKDDEGNKLCEELPASIAASVSKEKRKIRKRNKDAIRDHDVRENVPLVVESDKDALGSDNVLPENSFQNGRSAVLNDVSSVEIRDKRSASRKRRADEGTKVSRKNSEFESNKDKDVSANEQGCKLTENSSQSGPTANKKHKAEKKDGNESSLIEKGGLISDFVKQGTHPDITASSDFGQKLERLLAADASGGKKKKKKQKSNPNEVGSEISAVKDVNVETFQPIEAINHKYVGGEADPRFVSRKFSMGGAISEPCLILSAEIQEVSKTSRVTHLEGDDYMADTNDGNMESKNEEHEPDVASVIKPRDSIDEYAAHEDIHPTLVTQNDVGVLGYENQSGTLEDKIVEPKKSAKKIKKSKKTKDPVGVKEAVDATHDRGPTSDISPAVHPNSVIGGLLSDKVDQVGKTDVRADVVIQDVLDSLHECSNGPENEPDVASVTKLRDSVDQNAARVDSHPTLVTQNDNGVSGYENQSGTLEDKIVEPKKSAKKIKKSKKPKDPVGGKEAVDKTHDRGPTSDISPAVHPNSVIGGLLSDEVDPVGKTDVRADVVIQDVLDSLHECGNGPENEPDVASVTKLRDSVDQNAARVDSHPTLVTQNDNGVSGYENQSGTLEDKIVEPKKSAKKIKKSKKPKDPVGGKEAVDATHDRGPTSDISPAVHPTSVSSDLLSDKVDQDGKTDVRADVVIQDVPDPLHECSNGPENVDKKLRQKTKRKISSVVDTPESKGKDDADLQDPTAQADNMSEVSASSKSRRKTAKVNLHAAAQLNGSEFGSKNNMGVGISSVHTQLDSSVNTSKSSHEVRPIQDVVNVNHPKNILVDDADNSIEVSCESERIKSQHENKIVDSGEMHIVKATNKKGVETEVKEKKKKKKPDVQSGGSRTVLPSSQILNGNSRKEAKAQAAKSSSIQSQRSSSKVEPHGSNVQSRQTLLTISGSAAKEPLQTNKSDKNYSIPKEAQRPIDISSSRVHTHVEKNNAYAKRSTLERSNQTTSLNKGGNKNQSRLDIAKATGNNNVKVVNSLANTKSLLATAGTIFKHDDKESSDEDGVENSDSSTRTPSGSLSTSNYSDHSDANIGSSWNGSYNKEEEEGGGRNRKKPGPSSPKSMSFQAFLRNSSNYKKAKLTASQSQDLDSQPDEFVPDSQAI
ncbi:hypothetical protein PTKIN_Ptkin17bG0092600 [Pterospermum kingtungense]